jgi:protein-tyrosine phosphatase
MSILIDRDLSFPKLLNVRHLGGLRTRDGRVTRADTLVRADSPHQLTPEGIAALQTYGVHTVIDLRTEHEEISTPNPLRHVPGLQFERISLMGEPVPAELSGEIAPHVAWAGLMLEHNQAFFARVFNMIADAPSHGAVMFHCYAGKDRTGLIADILLDLAGVPVETIVEDYLLTNERLAEANARWLDTIADQERRDRMRNASIVIAETPIFVLETLRHSHGGSAGFLRHIGLSDASIDAIRARLISA